MIYSHKALVSHVCSSMANDNNDNVFWDGVLASGTTWLIHTGQEMMERAFSEE